MRKYRKKPVVIEAQQITEECFTCGHPSDLHVPGVVYDPVARTATCHTLEGDMVGSVGDWIIRGVKGELYPCRGDIFALTYEEADDDDA